MHRIDFQTLSLKLISESQKSTSAGIELLEEQCPEIVRQLRTDCIRGGPLAFWGQSQNVDEFVGQTIVHPAVLEVFATIAGRKISEKTPHAGIQHTYGYLFSTIETMYGFKRQRWLETQIETSFELPTSTLGPHPETGTLLANATVFAGMAAYRTNVLQQKRFQQLFCRASQELACFDLSRAIHQRLDETVERIWRGKKRQWTLQTDVITPRQPSQQQSVLIYSVVDHDCQSHQLITLFPIEQSSVEELLSRAEEPERNDIRLRFNAHVPALTGKLMTGTVCLHKLS